VVTVVIVVHIDFWVKLTGIECSLLLRAHLEDVMVLRWKQFAMVARVALL
jgi:hypothetical protein